MLTIYLGHTRTAPGKNSGRQRKIGPFRSIFGCNWTYRASRPIGYSPRNWHVWREHRDWPMDLQLPRVQTNQCCVVWEFHVSKPVPIQMHSPGSVEQIFDIAIQPWLENPWISHVIRCHLNLADFSPNRTAAKKLFIGWPCNGQVFGICHAHRNSRNYECHYSRNIFLSWRTMYIRCETIGLELPISAWQIKLKSKLKSNSAIENI